MRESLPGALSLSVVDGRTEFMVFTLWDSGFANGLGMGGLRGVSDLPALGLRRQPNQAPIPQSPL
jgi:hypothetical protein